MKNGILNRLKSFGVFSLFFNFFFSVLFFFSFFVSPFLTGTDVSRDEMLCQILFNVFFF